jgi:hypothetical protein
MEVMVPEGETVTLFPYLNPYLKVKNIVEHAIQIWMQTFSALQGRAGQGRALQSRLRLCQAPSFFLLEQMLEWGDLSIVAGVLQTSSAPCV